MTNPNDNAFPFSVVTQDEDRNLIKQEQRGLTKREYFAAMALQGLLTDDSLSNRSCKFMAEAACDYADALIKQLNDPSAII